MTIALQSLLRVLMATDVSCPEQVLLVTGLIDALSDADRVLLRDEAKAQGVNLLPRNLFFNYATQAWIS